MKKTVAIIMVLCMLLGISACGGSQESSGTQQGVSDEQQGVTGTEEAEAKVYAPVNLFDGNIYGGMSEDDAVAYLNGLSELVYLKTTGETVIHNIYYADNWLGLDYAHIDVQSYEGKVESVSYHFRDMNGDDVLSTMVGIYGDDYEDKSKDNDALYLWQFADGAAFLRYEKGETDDFIEFVVQYSQQ